MTGIAEPAPSDTVDETIRLNHYHSQHRKGTLNVR